MCVCVSFVRRSYEDVINLYLSETVTRLCQYCIPPVYIYVVRQSNESWPCWGIPCRGFCHSPGAHPPCPRSCWSPPSPPSPSPPAPPSPPCRTCRTCNEAGVLKKFSLAGLAKLSRRRYSWQRFVLASAGYCGLGIYDRPVYTAG